MEIEMKAVKSEAAEAVGYDERKNTLRIRYTGGRIYDYFQVPPQEYTNLTKSTSMGGYINEVIKTKYKNKEVI